MQAWLRNRSLRAFVAWSTCFSLAMPSAVIAGDGPFRLVGRTSKPTAVEQLAERIDHMERSLDEYGSIVIKTPDVWGESRLMRHRSEVENQLEARLNSFDFKINAVQSTRDAAFLATAIALQGAMGDKDVPRLTNAALTEDEAKKASNVTAATMGLVPDPNGTNVELAPRQAFQDFVSTVDGKTVANLNVSVEPVIELDQLNRYLQHLNELRRLNEGDDNADTPGYALNLIRIPVSILPGRKTEEGFGAEVQITVDPYISEEVLPLAFKDFVINGLVDRISFDVFQIALTSDIKKLYEECKNDQRMYWRLSVQQVSSETHSLLNVGFSQDEQTTVVPPIPAPTNLVEEPAPAELALAATGEEPPTEETIYGQLKARNLSPELLNRFANEAKEDGSKIEFTDVQLNDIRKSPSLTVEQKKAVEDLNGVSVDVARSALNRYESPYSLADVNQQDLGISASHRSTVDGDTLLRLALHSYNSLVQTGRNGRFPYKDKKNEEVEPSHRIEHGLTMPEVQSLMKREALAAYDFLSQHNAIELWNMFSGPDVARQIREHRRNLREESHPAFSLNRNNVDQLADGNRRNQSSERADINVDPLDGLHVIREGFFRELQRNFPQARNSVTEALVWQILVEAALVNDQLCKDMRETATLKNCPCVNGDWMQFYGPNTTPEAKMAFREYVKCKWPIHVFALDPVTQDQNIADSFSQRREMQMSLAIAAANQGLGGQALSRFVRRMEYDLETIELNRTAVAFSHGDNTFGWRFYPRVQSPPVPSNLQATVNDLLIGGQSRDSLVRTRKLEPGIRECTALVVMPSFVPQVTVDVRSNYFRLAKHTPIHQFMHRKPGYESSMELSKELTELRRLQQQCINDAHLYRDGEVFRLCKAVERLDDRLPLQTHNVTVPWENELGGFEVFQSGASMLEPELHGWYGPAGIIVSGNKDRRDAIAEVARRRRVLNEANLKYTLLGTPPSDIVGTQWEKPEKERSVAVTALSEAEKTLAAVEATYTTTALYLAGKNFSVLNCRVIAGGVDVTNSIEVINRNLMQIRIPSNVSAVTTEHETTQQSVLVHLATPHGATSPLWIPVEGDEETAESGKALDAAEKATKAASDAQGDATKALEDAKAAKKLADRFPVQLHWNLKATEFKVRCSKDGVKICNYADSEVTIVDTDPIFSDGKFESDTNGCLWVLVTIGEKKPQAIPVGTVKAGHVYLGDPQTEPAAKLQQILTHVFSSLSICCDHGELVKLKGCVTFNNGQPKVYLDEELVFTVAD